ncbi:MAG: response regulator [Terricaulis sp.]
MTLSEVPASAVPTILLVEPDVLIRLSLADYLRGCGFQVIEAAHAEEGKMILASDAKVDVVLADAQMPAPAMGFAFAQWVRRRRPSVTLILAASILNKAKAAAELCDSTPIRPKPCEHGHLADRIQSMLARSARKSRAPRALFGQRVAGLRKV